TPERLPLLPLFPLDVVLLPGTPLPLHIFEPRYKEMIGECEAEKRAFGVVRAKEEGLEEIGCTAEIIAVVKQYPDARLDIVAEGRERFEIVSINQERSFLRAEVRYLPSEKDRPQKQETDRAIRFHAEILTLAGATAEPVENQDLLSFRLAGSLP